MVLLLAPLPKAKIEMSCPYAYSRFHSAFERLNASSRRSMTYFSEVTMMSVHKISDSEPRIAGP